MESVKPSSIKWKAQKEKRGLAFPLVSDFILVAIQINLEDFLDQIYSIVAGGLGVRS